MLFRLLFNSRTTGPGLLLLVLLFVWLCSIVGVFALPDAWLYREYHSVSPHLRSPSQVVLVEVDRRGLERDAWLRLMRKLQRADVRAVAVLVRPEALTDADERKLLSERVIMGRSPDQADSRYPFLTVPPSYHPELNGIHQPRLALNGESFVSLESALVSTVTGRPVGTAPFLIDFRPGTNYLPRIGSARVMSGDLTSDLLRDKVIIIGSVRDPAAPYVLTPLPVDTPMTRLDYAGYAVDTLLHDRPVRTLEHWQVLLLMLAGLAVAGALYFRFGVRYALLFSTAGTLLLLIAGWVSLHFMGRMLPVAELSAFTWLVWLVLVRREQHNQSATVGRMLRAASSRLHERLQPEDFNASVDPWGQIMMLVTQVLNLERAILLERIPRGRHVREIKAYNCSIDDIDERRRDFERTPYSTALREGSPILLARTYLREREGDGQQFLAPLQFNGQVLGFFSGEVSRQHLDNNPMFMPMLQSFSLQISELLYQRQRWQARQRAESSRWVKLLRLESVQLEYKALKEASDLVERRLNLLENVVNGLQTGTVMYDPFGRVLQINHRTEELVKRAELSIFSWTAADLLSVLVGISIGSAREHMQQLVREEQPLVFSARLPNCQESFMLYVRSLRGPEADAEGLGTRPFNLLGFLFELVDTRHLSMLSGHEDELMRRGLDTLEQALRDHAGQQDHAVPLRILHNLRQLQDEQGQRVRLDRYPVSAQGMLNSLIARWQASLSEQGISLQSDVPEQDAIIRVDLMQVDQVLDGLISLLRADSVEQGRIDLLLEIDSAVDTEAVMRLTLRNQGYGMPSERLQTALPAGALPGESSLPEVATAARALREWGGELRADAGLGRGIEFVLQLPCHFLTQARAFVPGVHAESRAAADTRDTITE